MINNNYSINSNSLTNNCSINNHNSTSISSTTARIVTTNSSSNSSSNTETLRAYSKYKQKSTQFYDDFDSKFAKLKRAANKLKGDSNQNIFKDSSITGQELFDSIKDFVDDYNDSISFLKDNSKSSDQIADLLYSYKKLKVNSSDLSSIGLSIDESTGKINLNQTTLANALTNDKDNVEKIITNTYDGLATKAYNKTAYAINNSENLFPKFKLNLNFLA